MGKEIYRKAIDLKNEGSNRESIAELKRILERSEDSLNVCNKLIASIFYYRLDNHINALPFARKSVVDLPNDEMVSMCLVHCLFESNLKEEMNREIERYVGTGRKLELYQTFFEENNIEAKNFT